MSNNLSAIKRGEEALNVMITEGIKITKNAVAKRASFSHTNFRYAEFADLKDDIEASEAQQILSKQTNNMEALKQKVTDLEVKLKAVKNENKMLSGKDSGEIQQLMEKLTECYRLNDQLRGENGDLRNQLLHQTGNVEEKLKVDKETGEVISGIFNK